MEIILENRIRLKNCPSQLRDQLIHRLQIANPKHMEAQAAGRSVRGIPQYITNFMMLPDDSLVVPRGMRLEIITVADTFRIPYTLTDKRSIFEHVNIDSSVIKFKPYQFEAVLKLMKSGPEGILVAPAGSGKTVMGLSLIPMVGQPTLWLTHTGPLAHQAIERANTFLPDIGKVGLFGEGKWIKGDALTVGMVQTLIRNPQQVAGMMNDFGMVILDEAHHCPARTFLDVLTRLNPHFLYGLTATPYRRDGLQDLMFQTIGPANSIVPIAQVAADGGIIVPTVKCRYFYHPNKVDDNNIQRIIKENILYNPKRNSMIVEDVIREAKAGHFCIVISDRRNHCEILNEKISKLWPKTGIATGKYNKKYIQEQVGKFNDNEITVLNTTFSLLGEGFDVPFLDRAFICMPFRAEAKTEQLIGRIQRYYEGKLDAVVYDYIDVNIGVVENQFYSKHRECRHRTYNRLNVPIES